MGCGGSSDGGNDKEFFDLHGAKVIVNQDKDMVRLEKDGTDMSGKGTAYGNFIINDNGKNSNMIYSWTFKTEGKGFKDPMDRIGIGIDGSGGQWADDCFYTAYFNAMGNVVKGPCYAWGDSGRRVNGSSDKVDGKNEGYKYGDIIKMECWLPTQTLVFYKNDKKMVEFTSVDYKNNNFRMAVRMQDNGASIELWEFEKKKY